MKMDKSELFYQQNEEKTFTRNIWSEIPQLMNSSRLFTGKSWCYSLEPLTFIEKMLLIFGTILEQRKVQRILFKMETLKYRGKFNPVWNCAWTFEKFNHIWICTWTFWQLQITWTFWKLLFKYICICFRFCICHNYVIDSVYVFHMYLYMSQ